MGDYFEAFEDDVTEMKLDVREASPIDRIAWRLVRTDGTVTQGSFSGADLEPGRWKHSRVPITEAGESDRGRAELSIEQYHAALCAGAGGACAIARGGELSARRPGSS